MNKTLLKFLSLFIGALVITIFCANLYEGYLDEKLELLKAENAKRQYNLVVRDKGHSILKKLSTEDNILILGSSELGVDVPQNPKYLFPNKQVKAGVAIVGRAHTQSLLDAIKLVSLENDKIVVIVSAQWFEGKDIDEKGTQANFSELQFYKYMYDDRVPKEDKLYVAQRLRKQLAGSEVVSRAYLFSLLYSSDNMFAKGLLKLLEPYYLMRNEFLILKDKHDSYKFLQTKQNNRKEPVKNIDWQSEQAIATKMGMQFVGNNDFYVDDDYYNQYLAKNIKNLKNSRNNMSLLESAEFEDYKLLLATFKQLGVKPYIVFMSTNGWYYDYIGTSREHRLEFYDKLQQITEEYDMPYLDLRDKEYEPYFYKDVMHLGWKGWLYVSEKITEHYK